MMGTGAFSEVKAQRDVSVEVVGDRAAYLGLTPTSPYATQDGGGRLTLDFDGSRKTGQGLNPDALTSIKGLFEVTNQDGDNIAFYIDTGKPNAPHPSGEPTFHDNLASMLNVSPSGLTAGGGRGANYAFFAGGANPDDPANAPENRSPAYVGSDQTNPLVLAPGDSVSVGFFIVVPDGADLNNPIDGSIVIQAYDAEVAGER